jgi:hypothetical protein
VVNTSMFQKIDYQLLQEQRCVLQELYEQDNLTTEQTRAIAGILNLTYCLAEWAVDNGITTETAAFPDTKE